MAALLLPVTLMLTGCGGSDQAGDGKKSDAAFPAGYAPLAGDVLFQSSPHTRLVDTIEGVSGSPLSHCGIVARVDGGWVVYEASDTVKATPLKAFIERGRDQGFLVYRFKDEFTKDIPGILDETRAFLDRPYDYRYRMDDEHIYCSELIFKAFENVPGQQLGELERLGDLNWEPFEENIKHFEDGPVPLDREMITPQGLSEAEQLVRVLSHKIATDGD